MRPQLYDSGAGWWERVVMWALLILFTMPLLILLGVVVWLGIDRLCG